MTDQTLPITLYGSTTCEDSALVRDRLRVLGIPYENRNREDDLAIDAELARWNQGNHVTPTLVFGNEQLILSEPSLEQLEDALREAGYTIACPLATEVRDARKNSRAPNFTLASTTGDQVTLYNLRRKRPVLFFAHAHDERICQGYARQLTNQRAAFDEYEATPLLVVPNGIVEARAWAEQFAREYPALADPGGRVHKQYAEFFGVDATGVLLVVLDSFFAPRVYSAAPEAGGLVAPGEVTGWLRLLDCECDE
jgi:peroxiredoxin